MAENLKKKRLETTENIFHLKDSIEDMLYSCTQFTIEHEEGTYYQYRRTRITGQTIYDDSKYTWTMPEIDSINWIQFKTPQSSLFTSLVERGFTSPLIKHFAECEFHRSPYKDPKTRDVLIKKSTTVKSTQGIGETYHFYRLNGGSLLFQRIIHEYPDFWVDIMKACNETEFLKISEIHLCADTNQDLMPLVSECIKKGHYESSGLHPIGYFTLGGHKVKGLIGKYSSKRREIKNQTFAVETLYFGHSKRNAVSIVIYDKKAEQAARKSAVSNCSTRIELRFNLNFPDSIHPKLIESLIGSYFIENGAGFRFQVFLKYLTDNVRFTRHFRTQDDEDLANWWQNHVLIPLYHGANYTQVFDLLDKNKFSFALNWSKKM